MITCPFCQSTNVTWIASQGKWKCNECGAHFKLREEEDFNKA